MKHLGIDVHQKYSEVCELSEAGNVVLRRQIPTTARALQGFFKRRSPLRVVIECGSVTPWVCRLIRSMGHEVVVVNPRRVRLIAAEDLRCHRPRSSAISISGPVPNRWPQHPHQPTSRPTSTVTNSLETSRRRRKELRCHRLRSSASSVIDAVPNP